MSEKSIEEVDVKYDDFGETVPLTTESGGVLNRIDTINFDY